MAKLIVSPQAALDAAAIVELLSDKAGIDVAAKYFREIDALFERISLFPRSGMRRPSLGRDIRLGVVEPYVIIYRYRADTVTVARIVDGRRNITRRLVRE
jgi:toxin ParE1/3/4